VKYVGNEVEQEALQKKGLNMVDKTLLVGGARISYCIWEVGGMLDFFLFLFYFIFLFSQRESMSLCFF
jgi:hypothetical protein